MGALTFNEGRRCNLPYWVGSWTPRRPSLTVQEDEMTHGIRWPEQENIT